jgi:hypothetical protein
LNLYFQGRLVSTSGNTCDGGAGEDFDALTLPKNFHSQKDRPEFITTVYHSGPLSFEKNEFLELHFQF